MTDMDRATQDSIATALWMREFDPAAIPADVAAVLDSPKNSPAALGQRMRAFLRAQESVREMLELILEAREQFALLPPDQQRDLAAGVERADSEDLLASA